MRALLDPKLFNYLVIALFVLAALRWGFARNWMQVAYWIGAIVLNVAVTMMAVK
jgi:hypothetical protein